MTKAIFPELKEFIIQFCQKGKIRNIDWDSIDIESSIDLDLDLFDLDMDLFLTEFTEHFYIDYSSFSWKNHGGYPSEGSLVFNIIRGFFSYKRPWVKKVCKHLYQPKLKIRALQDVIASGKLL